MRRSVGGALFAAAALLTACGGGGNSVPQIASAQITEPFADPAGSPEAFALPAAGGYSGTVLLTPAGAVSGVTLSLTTQTGAGGSIPAPTDSDEPLVFAALSMSSDIGLTGMPAFAFVAPDSLLQSVQRRSPQTGSNSSLLLGFFDPSNPSAGYQFDTTCALSGVTITCNNTNTPFDLLAFLEYVFELKQHHGPPPTPGPNSGGGTTIITVPTPAPIVCSPSPDSVGIGQSNVIDCTEAGYGGAFTWKVADPSIASVQQSNSLTYTFFSVTGLAPGTTTVTFNSQPGGTGSLSISVAP